MVGLHLNECGSNGLNSRKCQFLLYNKARVLHKSNIIEKKIPPYEEFQGSHPRRSLYMGSEENHLKWVFLSERNEYDGIRHKKAGDEYFLSTQVTDSGQ